MKFYGNGREIVWDKENSKALCQFINGEYETEDKRTIGLLKSAGYRSDLDGQAKQRDAEGQEVEAEQEEAKLEEMNYKELRDYAKKVGIKPGKKNKPDLLEALRR